MIRKIIKIDKEKCNGCGACASACHEGAIDIIDGKAELVREHFCDGLGDCLPECPTGAISFEEREAPAYDEEAVKEAQKKIAAKNRAMTSHSGCPGSKIMQIRRTETSEPAKATSTADSGSKLQNWPVQIKLAPVNAPYFDGSKLLIAADCTAYAYASFHQDFIRNKVTLIGCPKLDQVDYSEKLTAIIQNNNIQSVTIVRMEVPCCGGLEMAAKKALQKPSSSSSVKEKEGMKFSKKYSISGIRRVCRSSSILFLAFANSLLPERSSSKHLMYAESLSAAFTRRYSTLSSSASTYGEMLLFSFAGSISVSFSHALRSNCLYAPLILRL